MTVCKYFTNNVPHKSFFHCSCENNCLHTVLHAPFSKISNFLIISNAFMPISPKSIQNFLTVSFVPICQLHQAQLQVTTLHAG